MLVYLTIGNSDDKLSQQEWFNFVSQTISEVRVKSSVVHGIWYSSPESPWQNMCIGFEVTEQRVLGLRVTMHAIAKLFNQESIGWAYGDYQPIFTKTRSTSEPEGK